MGKKVDGPAARDYYDETSQTLQAQLDLAPNLFAAEQRFGPQYAQLQTNIARQQLPQMASIYENSIYPALNRIESDTSRSRVEGDLSVANQFGSQLRETDRKFNPENTVLLDELNRQAQAGLAANGRLTAAERREAEQGVRAGQSARGFGYGNADMIEEILSKGALGNQRRNEARQFAGSMTGLNNANYTNALQFAGARRSDLAGSALGLGGQGLASNAGAGPSLFNPESGYASDLYNTNFNAEYSSAVADANNTNALIGAGISTIGSLAGAGVGCWVAREVYGEDSPKWKQFRSWLFTSASERLRNAYIKNGERFAKWLKSQPQLRVSIREFMDSKIGDSYAV